MPDELEERLERALRAQPSAGAETQERARRAALAAMPPGRRRGRGLLAAVAVCGSALVFGGVTLAAGGGRLPLVGGGPAHHPHEHGRPQQRRTGVALPRGAVAFAVASGGRVWLASSSGTALRGTAATAFGLSPGAVWGVVGSDGGVRAVGVQQHGAGFSRSVSGTPVAAAWAPAGIRIAYVVRTAAGDRLFDMYGNGTHDFHVADRVAPVAPSWRWDSEAFAYVSARGRVMVHDAVGGATSALPRACGLRRAAAVAFAPFGGLLAVADDRGRLEVADTMHGARPLCERGRPGDPAIAWLRSRQLVVGAGGAIVRYDLHGRSVGVDVTAVPGTVAGLAAGDAGRRLALALRDRDGGVRVVEAHTPRFSSAARPLRLYRLLLTLRRAQGPVALSWQ